MQHTNRLPAASMLQQLSPAFRSQSKVCISIKRRRLQHTRLEAHHAATGSPVTLLPSLASSLQWTAPRSQCAHHDAHLESLEQQQASLRRRRNSGKCCSTSAGAAALGTGLPDSDGAQTAAAQWRLPLPRLRTASLTAPLTWGFMLSYLVIMLIVPISALLSKASLIPPAVFWARATEPVAMSAYFVTFSVGLAACFINAVFGFMLAWVLVKYNFPGKKWVDAAVDLPFALPTSVAGLTLATVYSDEGLIGAFLAKFGISVVFNRLGVAVAMVFVSFPFVVRTMQPVLQEMEREVEEAAWSLGASPWRTFTDVLLPPLLPPLLTGTALAFSRAIGEFGSIVIVSSNFPFKDLIAPVLIFQCLEQYDFVGATVIGTVLLLISLVMMVGVNWLQAYAQRFRK